jgi:hypothetical protein
VRDPRASLSATVPVDGDAPPEPAGLVGGRYVIERLLGSGAMGAVFAAHDQLLDRPVALKVGVEGDLREARAMARLSHPNVVQVFDVGATDDGAMYIVTERVDGVTLDRWLRERAPDAAAILAAFCAAGRGLAAAHAAGVVHRDFKPQNVMVDREGRVRVLDFGLARSDGEAAPPDVTGAPASVAVTVTGAIAGTPRYMSPEQWRGEALDARTDQFSFCVALAQALGGLHPFDDTSIPALRDAVLSGTPPLLSATLPPRVADVLRRGLAHRREDRYATIDEVVRAIEPRAPSRRRWWIAGALAVLVAAVVVAGLAVRRARMQHVTTHDQLYDVAVNLMGFRCGANFQTYAVEHGVRCVRFDGDAVIWYGEGLRADGAYRELGHGRLGGEATAAGLAGNGEARADLVTLTLRAVDARRIDVGGGRTETWRLTGGWHAGYTSALLEPIHSCGPHLRRFRVYAKDSRIGGSDVIACVTADGTTWMSAGHWGAEPFRTLGTNGFTASLCMPGTWCGAFRHGRVGAPRLRRRQMAGVGEVFDFTKPFPELWFPSQRRHAVRLHVVRVVDDDVPPVPVAEIELAVRRANERLAADDVEVLFIADDVETLLRSEAVDPPARPRDLVVQVERGTAWEDHLVLAARGRALRGE